MQHDNQPVQIIEGFSAYDGNLGDKVGDPHKGIDFVRKNDQGEFQTFSVHAAHDGEAVCGFEESFGSFIIIRKATPDSTTLLFETVYAHLDMLKSFPKYLNKRKGFKWPEYSRFRGRPIEAGELLGMVGTSGWTNGIPQLHFELHEIGLARRKPARQKIDPYGINDRFSSGRYPQPGNSLEGLPHFWTTDLPRFA